MINKELQKLLKKFDPEWVVMITREEEDGTLDDYPILGAERVWDGNVKIEPEISIKISDRPGRNEWQNEK